MNKKKVLHIFPEFKRGGAQINVLRFISATKDRFDHYVAAAPYEDSLYKEYEKNTINIFPINMTKINLLSLFKLILVIKDLKPDIIHVNGKGGALYGFLVTFFIKKDFKMFHTMRGFHIKFKGLKKSIYLYFEYLSARRMDGNIMVSPSERDFLVKNIPSIPKEKLLLIPNGIDIKEAPLPGKMQDIVKNYSVNIISLSRLSPQKDLLTMIDGFDRLALKNKEAALHILGGDTPQDSEYAELVKDKISYSPFKERIFLWGSVKDAGNLIGHFQVYWSTALFEGLPTAIVEAALNKVLIVGTDCVGNIDIIRGESGILTGTGDLETISNGIQKGVEIYNKEEGKRLIKKAFEICSQFSIKNNCASLIDLYDKED